MINQLCSCRKDSSESTKSAVNGQDMAGFVGIDELYDFSSKTVCVYAQVDLCTFYAILIAPEWRSCIWMRVLKLH